MEVQVKSTWRASPPIAAQADCTLCQGTGWQLISVSGLSSARRCSCGILHRTVQLKEQVRIPQRYEHCTLDRYQPTTLSQARALEEARRFANRFPGVDRGLFFMGSPGTGKTHLAVGILLELLQRFHEDILFFDFQSLLDPGWRTMNGVRREETGWSRMKTASLLVLDNLDLQQASSNVVSLVQHILFARMRGGKATVFTAGRVETRKISRTGPSHIDESPNSSFLSALHQHLAVQCLSNVKFISVTGDDFRQREGAASNLF
jgi:DNA replication protein DnaC